MPIVTLLIHSVLLIFMYMTLFFIASLVKKNNTLVDYAWGTGFIIIAIYSFITSESHHAIQIVITTLVILWGMRITIFLLIRNRGKTEDVRYKQLRETWGKDAVVHSFFKIFMLQGALLVIIAYPVLLVNATITNIPFSWIHLLALLLWIAGFITEGIADLQLYLFLKKPESQGKIMTTGLWKYSRHPNYFGEIIMWWSLWIITLSTPYGWTGIISPLTITSLLLFVSGIPMAEALFDKNEQYQNYKKRTSVLIPWFPKK